jgi:hypothetical protein
MRRCLPVITVAVLAMGAGPCELFEGMAGGDAGAGSCTGEGCLNQLTVELIRADNDAFLSGAYWFALDLPDGSHYSIDCYLAHPDAGMECEIGDLDVMFPVVEQGAARIWLIVVGAPVSVVVAVEYNGYIIGERELFPDYEEIFPDGEQCPSWFLAEESMAVTPW